MERQEGAAILYSGGVSGCETNMLMDRERLGKKIGKILFARDKPDVKL